MKTGPTKVFLVDDHPVVLAGIKASLKKWRGMRIVGQALSGEEAMKKVRKTTPDVILMDIALPGMNGADAMQMLAKEVPSAKFLIHTMHDELEFVKEFLRLGASGYVLKGSSPSELIHAIDAVRRGGKYFSPKIGELLDRKKSAQRPLRKGSRGVSHVLKGAMSSGGKTGYNLTPKEKEVLAHMVEGMTMRDIADRMCISDQTITSHFKHIHQKLHVHTRVAAVVKAMKEGLA